MSIHLGKKLNKNRFKYIGRTQTKQQTTNNNTALYNMDKTEKQENIDKLVQGIEDLFETNDIYTFRPIKIDGIQCYINIYNNYNLVNIESVYVRCEVDVDGTNEKQKYSLYHFEYNTLEYAIKRIAKVVKNNKFYNGELLDKKIYEMSKLEETILPYSEDEVCSICMENTTDITVCKHSICLHCREKCIIREQKNCPVCRRENILDLYNTNTGLINNQQYDILKRAIHSEKKYTVREDDYYGPRYDTTNTINEIDFGDEDDIEHENNRSPISITIPTDVSGSTFQDLIFAYTQLDRNVSRQQQEQQQNQNPVIIDLSNIETSDDDISVHELDETHDVITWNVSRIPSPIPIDNDDAETESIVRMMIRTGNVAPRNLSAEFNNLDASSNSRYYA